MAREGGSGRGSALERLAGSRLLAYPVLFAALGLGLLRTWQSWLLGVFVGCFSGEAVWVFSLKTLYDFGQLAGAVACVAILRRLARMGGRGWPAGAFSAFCAAGTAVAAFAQAGAGTPGTAACAVAFFLTGAGYTGLFLLWVEWCGLLQPMQAMAACLGSYLVNSFFWLFLQGPVPAGHEILLAASSAAASCALLLACLVASERARDAQLRAASVMRAPSGLWRFRHVYAWSWLFTAVYGVGASYTQAAYASVPARVGIVAAAALMLLLFILAHGRPDMGRVYRVVFAAMGAGFLVAVAEPGGAWLMQAFLSASESLVMMFVFTFCCGAGRIGGVSAAAVYGVFRAGNMAAVIAARYTCEALLGLADINQRQTTVALALVMAVLLLFAALFFSRLDFRQIWDWIQERGDEDVLARRCRELGQGWGLGPREQSVLLLLARGQSVAEMADGLFIAPGTVKAHIGHIYEKAGVHSREELEAALLAGGEAGQGPETAAEC